MKTFEEILKEIVEKNNSFCNGCLYQYNCPGTNTYGYCRHYIGTSWGDKKYEQNLYNK